jgi:hypothetical protein
VSLRRGDVSQPVSLQLHFFAMTYMSLGLHIFTFIYKGGEIFFFFFLFSFLIFFIIILFNIRKGQERGIYPTPKAKRI